MTFRRIMFVCSMLAVVWFVRPGAILAEVGYVNILNGVEPNKAFVVERQGRAITPEGIYTHLEEGDVVKASAEALLLFTPTDTTCEAVEISGEFTATACPAPTGGVKDAVYDFVADEFMAAPEESVGVFATRGAKDKRVHSLPPQALKVFAESPELAASLKETPFIALAKNKANAEALILGDGAVELLSPGASGGRQFKLPAEEATLRQALLRRIHFKTMSELVSPNPWPAVELRVNIHTPVEGGPVEYDGRRWSVDRTVTIAQGAPAPIPITEPCLLTFKIVNRSDQPYYAYLVNYTEAGQIIPFLPPQEQAQMPNLIAAGAELPVAGVFLELGATKEFVRLILSENPLDLHPYSQASLDEPAGQTASAVRLRPTPADSWFTLVQTFEVK